MELEPDVLWAHQKFKKRCFGDECRHSVCLYLSVTEPSNAVYVN
ncbi:MAG: hypothetical protein Greene07147_173 [Parcubacteria group bacterium Greene0714_7]|nr:MAG: hypothetical protein Greene07147_173 [Parcubacteria group bacterium Greene0714_7]